MTRFDTALVLAALTFGCDRPTSAPPPATSAPTTSSSVPQAPSAPSSTPSTTPSAAPAASSASSAGEKRVDFNREVLGEPASDFEGVVGDWYVAEASGARGLEVDGSKWRNGTPSVGLADQAKRLYGERYAEFLDGVKAFAFFPFAVFKSEPLAGDKRISVRFFPVAGRVDQAAGIAFAIAPDGTYLGFRANALEDNLLYFRVVKGKRAIFDTVRNVSTPSKTWHTLAVELRGKQLTGELDGRKWFEKTLESVPQGKVGLWSKADSQVLFDDFEITPIGGS